jgi:hypothetical protein
VKRRFMMNFLEWRNGPAQRLLREAMGFDISQISSWEEYTQTFVYVVNRGGGHAVVEKMRDAFGGMSSGEQILFAASRIPSFPADASAWVKR